MYTYKYIFFNLNSDLDCNVHFIMYVSNICIMYDIINISETHTCMMYGNNDNIY